MENRILAPPVNRAVQVMSHSTRASLLLRVQDTDDEISWTEFFALYEPLLMRYVRSLSITEDDSRDIVQDIFIKLAEKLPQFQLDQDQGRFRTWLWRITRNAVIDHVRRRKTSSKAEQEWQERMADWEKSTASSPDDNWHLEHRSRILHSVLLELKGESNPRSWNCFQQHVVNKRPAQEVAKELGITANNVYANCSNMRSRIRQRCRDYLKELNDE